MKYENFGEAESLMRQIKTYESQIESLQSPDLYIRLFHSRNNGHFITIAPNSDTVHRWMPQAKDFISILIAETQQQIDTLKAKLETL